eukprot:111285-Chlamydomonas_euryale.AAC.1
MHQDRCSVWGLRCTRTGVRCGDQDAPGRVFGVGIEMHQDRCSVWGSRCTRTGVRCGDQDAPGQ